jgi:hypothetical protein
MGQFIDKSAPLQSLRLMSPIEQVTFGRVFSWAHTVLGNRWGMLVGCAAFIFFYGMISGIVVAFFDGMLVGFNSMFKPLEFLHNVLVIGPLSVGPIYISARLFRGQNATFNDIWIGFTRWGPVALIGFLIQLGYLLAMFPIGYAMVMMQSTAAGNASLTILLTLILGLLLIVGSLYFAVRLYFAAMLCADPLGPQLGVMESISESWRITRNCAWTLFFCTIVISIIVAITAMCLLIPMVLYGLPLTYAAAGAVYVVLTHQSGIIPVQGYDICPFCDYDLSDLDTQRCPECGAQVIRPFADPEPPRFEKPLPHEAQNNNLPDIPLSEPDEDPPSMGI